MIPAKKSLGQHWLNDERVLSYIAKVADIRPEDTVLEVGPGMGSLTAHLVKQAKRVVAVELDEKLATRLPGEIAAENLQVVKGDILKFNLNKLPKDYKVVANIPYYLTGHLLRLLISAKNPPASMVLLVQKEVAQRTCASPGDMSILSVSVQLYFEAELGRVVPARLFTPPPKVDSQVVILRRRKFPLFKKLDEKKFFQLVKAGFSNPRKKLRSSLSAGLGISKEEADRLLIEADVNGALRPEMLSLQQWYSLYFQLKLKKDLRALLRLRNT